MQDGDGVSWPGNISALDTSSPPLLQPSSSPLLSLASQHTTPSILTFCLFIFLPSKLCSIFYSFSSSSIRLLGKVYICACTSVWICFFFLFFSSFDVFSLPPRLNLFVLLVYSLFVVSFRRLGKVYVHICVDLFLLLFLYVFYPSFL